MGRGRSGRTLELVEDAREAREERAAIIAESDPAVAAWLAAGFELDTDEPPTGLVEIPI